MRAFIFIFYFISINVAFAQDPSSDSTASLEAQRLGEAFEEAESYDRAFQSYKKALTLAQRAGLKQRMMIVAPKFGRVSFALHYEGRPGVAQEALTVLRNCMFLAKAGDNYRALCEIILAKAILDRESTVGAPLDEQISDLRLLLRTAQRHHDAANEAFAKSGLGYVYIAAGIEPDSAWQYKQDALNYFNSNNIRRWSMGNDLSWFSRQRGQLKLAEQFSLNAMQLARDTKRQHAITEATYQLGETWLAQGHIKKVRALYDENYPLVSGKTSRDAAVFMAYAARLEWAEGKKEEALSHAREAVKRLSKFELFYEVFARASLTAMLYRNQDYEDVLAQWDVADKYNGRYVPYESMVRLQLYRTLTFFRSKPAEGLAVILRLKEAIADKKFIPLGFEISLAEAELYNLAGDATKATSIRAAIIQQSTDYGYENLGGFSFK